MRCSRSPATHVAQRIDVALWDGGLLQSEPISIFRISARTFRLSSDFLPIRFLLTIFSIICPFCQFRIFLEVEIFQSAFGGEPIKNPWRAVYYRHFRCEGNSRPELIGNVMENGFGCVKIKIAKRFRLFARRKMEQ